MVAAEPGTVVAGRYQLDRVIGEGGMGMVWAGLDLREDKAVALKFLKTPGPDHVRRFLREARIAATLRHPSIIRVHDIVDLEDGSPMMVMELLQGEPLAKRIERDHTLPLPIVVEIMVPVFGAVAAAHALGIVHRDLKPDNIFLVPSPSGALEVKVLDFGIAKLTAFEGEAAQTGGLTSTGAVIGTPFYMAPEQVFAEKNVDPRADIWALGVILYECLTGDRPISGESYGQIFKAITMGAQESIAVRMPELPAEIVATIDGMLIRDRAHRTADLHGVIDAFTRNAHAPSGSIRPPGAKVIVVSRTIDPLMKTEANDTTDAPVTGDRSALRADTHRLRPRSRVVALAAAAGVVVAGTLVWNAQRAQVATTSAAPAPKPREEVAANDRAAPSPPPPASVVPAEPLDAGVASATDRGKKGAVVRPPTRDAAAPPLDAGAVQKKPLPLGIQEDTPF